MRYSAIGFICSWLLLTTIIFLGPEFLLPILILSYVLTAFFTSLFSAHIVAFALRYARKTRDRYMTSTSHNKSNPSGNAQRILTKRHWIESLSRGMIVAASMSILGKTVYTFINVAEAQCVDCKLCDCYYTFDCPSGYYCGCYVCGCCSCIGKYDGRCISTFHSWSGDNVENVAKAISLYFDAYIRAIENGGGLPDQGLLREAERIPLLAEWHRDLKRFIHDQLDVLLGFDFMAPCGNGYKLGNIRAVPDIMAAKALVTAGKTGIVNAILQNDPEAVVRPLEEFWDSFPNYRPMHTGRCYPHGHPEVKTLEDIKNCQITSLKRAMEVILKGR